MKEWIYQGKNIKIHTHTTSRYMQQASHSPIVRWPSKCEALTRSPVPPPIPNKTRKTTGRNKPVISSRVYWRVIPRNRKGRRDAQWLRVLAALPRIPGLVLSPDICSWQSSVAPVSGDLTPSSVSHRHQACMWCMYIYTSKVPAHIQYKIIKFKKENQ